MPTPTFKPVLYLKSSCPFCLKLVAFLSEAGIYDTFQVRSFWPGDDMDDVIRAELAPHYEKPSFPTVQFTPGEFMAESDDIIAHYASNLNLNPDDMPFFQYVIDGPFRRMREQFGIIRDLTEKLDTLEG